MRTNGTIAWRLLEDVGREATSAIDQEASRLEAWLGGSRVIPRLGSPLEREFDS